LKLFREEFEVKRGIPFYVAYMSNMGTSHLDKWEKDGVKYEYSMFPWWARKITDEAGVRLVDLSQGFTRERVAGRSDALHYKIDGHWSPAGHRFMAESTAEFARRFGRARQADAAKID
jgi:hypothetical protein